jgi:tetratricopeptide (TPR) repeat protein
VARKGARVVREDRAEAAGRTADEEAPRRRPPIRHEEEVWVFGGVVDEDAGERPVRAPRQPKRRRPPDGEVDIPHEVAAELANAVGTQLGARLAQRMADAAGAYARDRYHDAFRITKPLADQVPESAAVRELHGLVCYRLGRWRDAIKHLEAARLLGGDDPSQLPVLMDCHRALGQHRRVGQLWDELRAASPDADVMAEGRMVRAADLADGRKIDEAVRLLVDAGAGRNLRHPAERHVRQWYVLADLLERAGDLPRARELFGRVVVADPDLADAADRLAALGRTAGHGRRSAPSARR